MISDDFPVGCFLPFRRSNMVLRVDEGIAQETWMAHDANKLFGWQVVPLVPIYLGIVNLMRDNGVSYDYLATAAPL